MELDFDDIRPFTDDEVAQIMDEMAHNDQFMSFVHKLAPRLPRWLVRLRLKHITSIHDLQFKIVLPIIERITHRNGDVLTSANLKDAQQASLFVTNHRDIVMDSAFLDILLGQVGLQTAEIGIGDNLLAAPWIEKIVRCNRTFIVHRSLPPRELPRAFMQLSSYIRYAITQKNANIWIAQREGRAKDSDDRTQESILKMFALSGEGSFIENLKALNISPVSISYEYDPCDYLKAKEFQQKRDDANYKKSKADDVLSMKTGIMQRHGRIHYVFTPNINTDLDAIAANTENRKEQVAAVAALIDQRIHANYAIFPINKVAYDELFGTQRFANEVSSQERKDAMDYFARQLAKIDLPNADEAFLHTKLIEIYANPLKNQLETLQKLQKNT